MKSPRNDEDIPGSRKFRERKHCNNGLIKMKLSELNAAGTKTLGAEVPSDADQNRSFMTRISQVQEGRYTLEVFNKEGIVGLG